MTTIPTPSVAAEVPALPPDERRARKLALQSELEQRDELRDGLRSVVRELHTLQWMLDKNPVRNRALYDRNVEACARYTEAFAIVSNEYRKLDNELSSLCRVPAGTLLQPIAVDQFGEIVDDDGMVTPGILAELAGGAR